MKANSTIWGNKPSLAIMLKVQGVSFTLPKGLQREATKLISEENDIQEHITLLMTSDQATISRILQNGEPTARMQRVARYQLARIQSELMFWSGPHSFATKRGKVLHLKVQSTKIAQLHRQWVQLSNWSGSNDDYNIWQPHITLGYFKRRQGMFLPAMQGIARSADELHFSYLQDQNRLGYSIIKLD